MTCEQCNAAKLRLKKQRESQNYFVACSGYPNCKFTSDMPKGVEAAQMTDQNCPRCRSQRRDVKLFDLTFHPDYVSEAMRRHLPNGKSARFCINKDCDPDFKQLLELTRSLGQKKTYN